MKIADIIIIVILLLLALIPLFFSSNDDLKVYIKANNKEYYYPLNEDRIITVDGKIGETVIKIEENSVSVVSSTCLNGTCLNYKASSALATIVCLPNEVVIKLKGDSNVKVISH